MLYLCCAAVSLVSVSRHASALQRHTLSVSVSIYDVRIGTKLDRIVYSFNYRIYGP